MATKTILVPVVEGVIQSMCLPAWRRASFCLPTAAETMAEFLAKVVERCGRDALDQMTKLKINRGPLVSRSPATDFLNQTKGNLYAHKKLRGTDAFALTHSSTPRRPKISKSSAASSDSREDQSKFAASPAQIATPRFTPNHVKHTRLYTPRQSRRDSGPSCLAHLRRQRLEAPHHPRTCPAKAAPP